MLVVFFYNFIYVLDNSITPAEIIDHTSDLKHPDFYLGKIDGTKTNEDEVGNLLTSLSGFVPSMSTKLKHF